jgi:mRNA interferase RelE/StbE
VYEAAFHPDAVEDLKGLDKSVRQRILDKIHWLLEHVEEMRHTPPTAQWAGMYRLRVGDYRVVYEIDRPQGRVIIYAVGDRHDIYKVG